MYVSVKM